MALCEDRYHIVIVGAGPVGLFLSLCLSRWGYNVKHIDNRPVPTKTGRADGIQPRSLEILRNLGLKRKLMAYGPARIYDVAFWGAVPGGKGIHHIGNWPSCPQFIDTRYPFSTLLHQGKIEKVFLEEIARNGTIVDRPWTIVGFNNDGKEKIYPVEVKLKNLDTNVEQTVRTRYLFSGEGATSFVREQLGIQVRHKEPIAYIWGVMDGVVRTDFPDIETKCTIHSDNGSMMVIPREDNMVRLYIQIASSTDPDWDPRKTATVHEVQQIAKKILLPYNIEWDRVEWYSVYPIRQCIAEKYTLDHRIFIGGDACHTHSPKAGQGMNTAFHDALNFAWKMHLVEAGFAKRSILATYEAERKLIAEKLLDLDARYASLFSQRRPSAYGLGSANAPNDGSKADEFVDMYKSSCEFTSGYGIVYQQNVFNWGPGHPAKSPLLSMNSVKLSPGRILPPSTVTRLSDANIVALEQEVPVNGSFRIYVFGGNPTKTQEAISDFTTNLEKEGSFYSTYLRQDFHSVSYFERHNPHSLLFTFLVIYAARKNKINLSVIPKLLRAYTHHIYADELPGARLLGAEGAAHEKLGLNQENGGIVIARPDGHVACTVQLVTGSGTVDALNEYFGAFASKPLGRSFPRAQL